MRKFFPLSALMLIVASCAPRSDTETRTVKDNPASGSPTMVAAAVSTAAVPAAHARLATLGLTVFDAPKDIPAFTLSAPDGTKKSIGDFAGKYVFLNFWATWCPPCREEMPSMETLHERMKDSDFSILAVSVREDPKTVKDFLAKTPYSFPIVLDTDGAVSSIFVGRGIPTTYILDPDGRAIAGMVGSRQWDTAEAFAVFEDLVTQ